MEQATGTPGDVCEPFRRRAKEVGMDTQRWHTAAVFACNPVVRRLFVHDQGLGIRASSRHPPEFGTALAFRGQAEGATPSDRALKQRRALLEQIESGSIVACSNAGAALPTVFLAHDLVWWSPDTKRYEPAGQEGRNKFFLLMTPFRFLEALAEPDSGYRLTRGLNMIKSVRTCKKRPRHEDPEPGETGLDAAAAATAAQMSKHMGEGQPVPRSEQTSFCSLYKRHSDEEPLLCFVLDVDGKTLLDKHNPEPFLDIKYRLQADYMPVIVQTLRLAAAAAGIGTPFSVSVHCSTQSKPSFRVYAIGLDFYRPGDAKRFFTYHIVPRMRRQAWWREGLLDAALYKTCWDRCLNMYKFPTSLLFAETRRLVSDPMRPYSDAAALRLYDECPNLYVLRTMGVVPSLDPSEWVLQRIPVDIDLECASALSSADAAAGSQGPHDGGWRPSAPGMWADIPHKGTRYQIDPNMTKYMEHVVNQALAASVPALFGAESPPPDDHTASCAFKLHPAGPKWRIGLDGYFYMQHIGLRMHSVQTVLFGTETLYCAAKAKVSNGEDPFHADNPGKIRWCLSRPNPNSRAVLRCLCWSCFRGAQSIGHLSDVERAAAEVARFEVEPSNLMFKILDTFAERALRRLRESPE